MKKINYMILGFIGLVMVLMSGLGLAQKTPTQDLSRAVLKIDGLSCGGCFSTINAGLNSLEGYSGMGANLFRKLIAVDFALPLTAEKISQTLSELGYPGKLETIDVISKKESFAYIESRKTGPGSGGGSCCSGNGYPGSGNQSSSQVTPSPSGSCCLLPGSSQPTQDL
ncbi:heavy-metal-associated domain-containing protein [Desulfobacula sp.]